MAGEVPVISLRLQAAPDSVDAKRVITTPNLFGLELSESLLTGLVLVGVLLVIGIALVGVLVLFVLTRSRSELRPDEEARVVVSGHEDPWKLAGHQRSMMRRSHGSVGSGSMSSPGFNRDSIHNSH